MATISARGIMQSLIWRWRNVTMFDKSMRSAVGTSPLWAGSSISSTTASRKAWVSGEACQRRNHPFTASRQRRKKQARRTGEGKGAAEESADEDEEDADGDEEDEDADEDGAEGEGIMGGCLLIFSRTGFWQD